MSDSFTTAVDIANRALQQCGAARIFNFAENSKNADAVNFVYEKLRKHELRRNVWRFSIRKAVLRPVEENPLVIVPGSWNQVNQYLAGSIVTYNGEWYIANTDVSFNAPNIEGTAWERYYGPRSVQPWDSSTAYYKGELVYTPENATAKIYLSLEDSNSDNPTVIPAYDPTVTYMLGDTVTFAAVTYQSNINLNVGSQPDSLTGWELIPGTQLDQQMGKKWLRLGLATLKRLNIPYPAGSGPRNQSFNRNVYLLPHGFLREAPQDPKAGSVSFLGAPTGLQYTDWTLENDFIVTREIYPIVYRFAADIDEVEKMDPLFCEGLACRIALAVAEELTQSSEKLGNIGQQYTKFMGEARIVNGIETGPTEPPLDEYISCRI